ncbi:Flagellar hook-length control protein FliK [Solimonas aquatica]|uniref:Flagellar hook-length control protein FliK n=1 Tax=Solimonas aquatica TaxID=489703 RepID=A0A1H9HJT4_9GAMM|nr:flagellar hook-length control protein FliK [Solimonas aquatica]SEQ62609.1 Flagellar hook-length control protein FliK [Solimonas aquatica]
MIAIQANAAAAGTAPLAAPAQGAASDGFAGLLGLAATQSPATEAPAPLPGAAQPQALTVETTLALNPASPANAEALSPDAAAQPQGEGLPPVLLALRRLQPENAANVALPDAAATPASGPVPGAAAATTTSSTPAPLPASAALRRLLIRDDSATPGAQPDGEPAATLPAKAPSDAAAVATSPTSASALASAAETKTAAAAISKAAAPSPDKSPDTASATTSPAARQDSAARPPLPEAATPPDAAAVADAGDEAEPASPPLPASERSAPPDAAPVLRGDAATASPPNTTDSKAAGTARQGLGKPAPKADSAVAGEAAKTVEARPVATPATQDKAEAEPSTPDEEAPDAGAAADPALSAAPANDNPMAAAVMAAAVTPKAAPTAEPGVSPDPTAADRIQLPGKPAGRPAARDREDSAASTEPAAPAPASGLTLTPGSNPADSAATPAPTLAQHNEAVPRAQGSGDTLNVPANSASESGAASPSLATLLSPHPHNLSAPTGGSDAPASGSALSTPVPVDADLPEALGERVLMLSEAGVSSARIELHPAELGSLVVHIEVHNDQAQVAFSADNPATRSLLQQAMPQLRELFGSQGLQLMRTRVEERQRDGASSSAGGGFASSRARGESTPVRRIGRIRLVDAYV